MDRALTSPTKHGASAQGDRGVHQSFHGAGNLKSRPCSLAGDFLGHRHSATTASIFNALTRLKFPESTSTQSPISTTTSQSTCHQRNDQRLEIPMAGNLSSSARMSARVAPSLALEDQTAAPSSRHPEPVASTRR